MPSTPDTPTNPDNGHHHPEVLCKHIEQYLDNMDAVAASRKLQLITDSVADIKPPASSHRGADHQPTTHINSRVKAEPQHSFDRTSLSQYPPHPCPRVIDAVDHARAPVKRCASGPLEPLPEYAASKFAPSSSLSSTTRLAPPPPPPPEAVRALLSRSHGEAAMNPFAMLQGRKNSNAAAVKTNKLTTAPRQPTREERAAETPRKDTSSTAIVQLPEWYRRLSPREMDTLRKKERLILDKFASYKLAEEGFMMNGQLEQMLRGALSDLERTDLSAELLIFSKIMESQHLPRLINCAASKHLPFDIRADAQMLYKRWQKGDFECGLWRGLSELKGPKRVSLSMDKSWPFCASAKYFGQGDLVNGQWWPNQLCALRDGAHGDIEAGISGYQRAACSIVIAHSKYEDVDLGDSIGYCGTEGTATAATASTKLMIASQERGIPVRVLRSSSLQSKYAPKRGFRYDGLYRVIDHNLINPKLSHYRFALKREPGQDPIRFEGDGVRPTEYELEAIDKRQKQGRL